MRRLHFTHVLIGAGILARVAWALAAPPVVFDDAAGYRALARSLTAGHGYATAAGATAYWTPGWAAWMSIVYRAGGGDRAVALASVALGAATIAIVWALAAELFGRSAARLAAAIVALLPSLVLLPGVLLSENLAVPLAALAALALVRAARTRRALDFALFGAAVAAATYAREASAAFLLAGLFVGRRSLRSCAALAVAFSILVAPWVLRNRVELGRATLTTSAGTNLCIGLGEGATGGYRLLEGAKTPLAGPSSELERNEQGLRCAAEGLRAHPLELVTLAPGKVSRFLVWDDWIVDDFFARRPGASAARMNALRAFCNLSYWALLAAAVAGAWRERERDRPLVALVACALLATLASFGAGRFHAPLLPLFAVLASAAWYRRVS